MLDHVEIRALLPHGPAMVLVDRVVSMRPAESIVAEKAVTGTDRCFERLPIGSRGDRCAYPASLVLESFGQAAAILWLASADGRRLGSDRVIALAGMRNCRVEGHAFPGDVLRHVASLDHPIGDTIFVTGETWVRDRRILVVESMIAAVRPRAHLGGPRALHG